MISLVDKVLVHMHILIVFLFVYNWLIMILFMFEHVMMSILCLKSDQYYICFISLEKNELKYNLQLDIKIQKYFSSAIISTYLYNLLPVEETCLVKNVAYWK